MVWAIDFQFDATVDGKAVKIASGVDEHTRESILDVVDRSITGETLVAALKAVIAVRGLPLILRLDKRWQLFELLEMISDALRDFCDDQIGIIYVPPGSPWRNGFVESFNNRVRDEGNP